MKTYLVGGAVRDKVLDRPVHDRDYVVVGSSVDEMILAGFKQVGADFPVFLHPQSGDEYALARTERKSGQGYHGFQVDFSPEVTLEEDLARRDLTVNAMAMDDEGQIIDPFNGLQDIKDKVYRHTSDAFQEDPLRVLRVARFMARHAHEGWIVHPRTLDLMTTICRSGEMKTLTTERVWKELSRALVEKTPSAFVQTLKDCEALKEVLPEVDCLFGVPQPEQHHPEIDTGIHTLLVMDQAAQLSDRLEVRFGAMVHDLGKGVSDKNMLPRHLGHEAAGIPLVKTLCDRLKAPNNVRSAGVHASEYHLHIHRAFDCKATTLVKMFNALSLKNKPHQLEDLVLIAEADARGRTGLEDRPYPQADYIRFVANESLKYDGKAIAQSCFDKPHQIPDKIYQASVAATKQGVRQYKGQEEPGWEASPSPS